MHLHVKDRKLSFATAAQTSESDTTSTSSPMQSMKSYAIPKLEKKKRNLITTECLQIMIRIRVKLIKDLTIFIGQERASADESLSVI